MSTLWIASSVQAFRNQQSETLMVFSESSGLEVEDKLYKPQ